MNETTVYLHTQFQIDRVDRRIFGGFLEHMGRAVYQGIYDPESVHADDKGFRKDVLSALDELGFTTMRYPGGNFASGYHWMDGVGLPRKRPAVRELAWQSLEPNQIGTDEYITLCRKMGWTPMITVNLGTGTPEEARNWVEYCNCPTGSRYADQRASNGNKEPFGVKLWCLGNEMDGHWQLGHVPADQYAIRAQQAAKMMKDTDADIELVACGSCGTGMATYMEWDQQVLSYLGELADYVSLHRYSGNRNDDTADFLAEGKAIDRQIEEMDAACRFVQAKARSSKRTYLCFDEWNVWYKNHESDGKGKFAPHLIEEVYNLEDALVVGSYLNSFIRHADAVKIANLAQIVNVIAPIQTRGDELLIQSIFYPFQMVSKRREGTALQVAVSGPVYDSQSHGPTQLVDASAILNQDKLSVFAVNRSLDESAMLRVVLADRQITGLESAERLSGTDPKSANSFEEPGVVKSQAFEDCLIADGQASIELLPLSFSAVSLKIT